MEISLILFAVLALANTFAYLWVRNTWFKYLPYVNSIGVLTFFSLQLDNSQGYFLILAVIPLVAWSLYHRIWKWSSSKKPLISIILLVPVVFLTPESMYGNYPVKFLSPLWLSVLVFGVGIPWLIDLKVSAVKRFKWPLDLKKFEQVLHLFFVGAAGMVASFAGSFLGVALIGVLWLFADSLFAQQKSRGYWALILFAMYGHLLQMDSSLAQSLLIGKLWFGVFGGIFVVAILSLVAKAKKVIWKMGFLLLSIGLMTIALMVPNIVHPAFGGLDTVLFFGIGTALVSGFYGVRSAVFAASWWPLLFGLIHLQPQEIEPNGAGGKSKATTKDVQEVKEADMLDTLASIESLDFEEMGLLKFQSGLVQFELGQTGGITKGEITGVSGKLTLNGDKPSVSVVLNTKNLTTFNKYRDESVMGDAYLHASKFPQMNFESTQVEKTPQGFEIKGTFKMLGAQVEKTVTLKYTGKSAQGHEFVGYGTVDRRQHGMAPSPQEGDVVKFLMTFTAQ